MTYLPPQASQPLLLLSGKHLGPALCSEEEHREGESFEGPYRRVKKRPSRCPGSPGVLGHKGGLPIREDGQTIGGLAAQIRDRCSAPTDKRHSTRSSRNNRGRTPSDAKFSSGHPRATEEPIPCATSGVARLSALQRPAQNVHWRGVPVGQANRGTLSRGNWPDERSKTNVSAPASSTCCIADYGRRHYCPIELRPALS